MIRRNYSKNPFPEGWHVGQRVKLNTGYMWRLPGTKRVATHCKDWPTAVVLRAVSPHAAEVLMDASKQRRIVSYTNLDKVAE